MRKYNCYPGVYSAVKTLRPTAEFEFDPEDHTKFISWDCEENPIPPTWEEIEQQMMYDVHVWHYYKYERNRKAGYGHWTDQLEMIYNDLKDGNLENGTWIKMIDEVKSKYPKPEGERPD